MTETLPNEPQPTENQTILTTKPAAKMPPKPAGMLLAALERVLGR